MKKNKKEKLKKENILKLLVNVFEILLLLILVIGYICQIVVYTSRTITYFSNGEYSSYTEIFYDVSFGGEDDKENFEYLYNITTNHDRELIRNNKALESEIVIFTWTELLKRIVWIITLLILCEFVKIFLDDKKKLFDTNSIAKITKTKIRLAITFTIILITNAIVAIFTPFETNIYGTIVFIIIIYYLLEIIENLVTNGKLKTKE